MAVEHRRLFVGGLFEGISQQELEERFSKYGQVGSVEIISRIDENGDVYKTFGYVDLKADDSNVKKCLKTYNGSKWKGHSLTIQTAKESFQQRLKREREEEEKCKERLEKKSRKTKSAKERLQESFSKAGVKDFNIRNAVPGTEITGEKNWTVTKFGRVVPIVYIRSKNKRKVNKIDPSKHSHALRRVKDENDSGTDVGSLTWELDATKDEVQYQKRIGAYSNPSKKKKRKLSHPIDVSEDEESNLLLSNRKTGSAFYYQYTDNKEKDNDFEVVSNRFERNVGLQDTATENVCCRIYNSDDEDDVNVLMLPKAKNKPYLSATPKSRDGDKGQKETELVSIVSHQRTSAKEECTETCDIVEPDPSKMISNKLIDASNSKEHLKKGSSIPEELFEPSGVSSNGSDSDDTESEKSLEKQDTKEEVTMPAFQICKALETKSDAEESGYNLFATKGPVDAEEDYLDVVNTDSSKKFYYQSEINPLTKKTIDYIILETQSIEMQQLNVLQKESSLKKCAEKNEKREESEEDVSQEDEESETERKDTKKKVTVFEFQQNESTKSEEESGYNIFATKEPVDNEEYSLDVVNTDSSGTSYYQSEMNPLTKRNIDYIVLEQQSIETQALNFLQKESLRKRKKNEKNEGEDEESENRRKDIKRDNKSDDRKVNKPISKSVAPVTSKRSVADVCDQWESIDDAVSVSSADTDEICLRKAIKLSGEISQSMMTSALDIVEFDQMDLLANENIDGDIRLSLKDGFGIDEDCKNKRGKMNKEQKLNSDEDKKKTKEVKDNIYSVADDGNDHEEDISNSGCDTDEKSSHEEQDVGDQDVNDVAELSGNLDGSSGEDVGSDEEDGNSCEEVNDGDSGEDVANDDADDSSGEDVSSDEEDDDSSAEDVNDDEDGDSDDANTEEDSSSDEDGNSSDEEDSSDEDDRTPKLTSPNSVNGKKASRSSKKLDVKKPTKVLDLSVLNGNPAKKACSNVKRLASMQKKSKVMLEQKKAIQKALAAVDSKAGPAQGNHIVFDSDDEDDVETANIIVQDKRKSSQLKPTNKGPKLFASDDEDSGEDDDDARFQNKPQFEGKSGARLRKLQEQIGGDNRFSMDKRFLEDQSDDENDPNLKIENSSDEDVDNEVDLNTEKEKSMSILQGIVGTKAILSRPKEVQGEKLGFLGKMIRYDPSRDDHTLYEVKTKEKKPSTIIDKKSTKKNKVNAPEVILPEVSKEKYFEVSGDITEAFGSDKKKTDDVENNDDKDTEESSKKDSTFRFFGDSDDEEDTSKPAGDEAMLSEALPRASEFSSTGSKYRFFESSDEEMEEEDTEDNGTVKSDDVTAVPKLKQWFFFQQDDERLNDGPLQFYRKENIDSITKKWQENRSNLMTLSRNRYRKAIREKKKKAQRMMKKKY